MHISTRKCDYCGSPSTNHTTPIILDTGTQEHTSFVIGPESCNECCITKNSFARVTHTSCTCVAMEMDKNVMKLHMCNVKLVTVYLDA